MKRFQPIIDRSTSLLKTRWLPPLLIGLLAGITLAVLTVVVVQRNNGPGLAPPDPVRLVRVTEVRAESGQPELRLPGIVRASEYSTLAFLHGGQLVERKVRRGEQVLAGQTLAMIHNPALMPGLAAAEAQVAEISEQLGQLEREVRRLEDLHRRDLVPTEELERIRSRRNAARNSLEQAQARRNEARDQLEEARLRAPFAGTVIDLYAETGEFISAGQPVLSISGHNGLEIELRLGSDRAAGLQTGQTVSILGNEGQPAGTGILRDIGQAGPGHPATVVVEVESNGLRHGQNVRVELDANQPTALSVPLAAIIDPAANGARVFRIANGRAIEVPVTLGPISAGRVRIEGALAEGDPVVIAGQGQLLDDDPVRILP